MVLLYYIFIFQIFPLFSWIQLKTSLKCQWQKKEGTGMEWSVCMVKLTFIMSKSQRQNQCESHTVEVIMMFFSLCMFSGDRAQVVVTSSKGIRWLSTAGTEYKEVAPRLPGPGPVAALVSNRTLYMARQGRDSIYRYQSGGVAAAATDTPCPLLKQRWMWKHVI